MRTRDAIAPGDLAGLIGQEVGVSDWITVDQARIDAFATTTEDDPFLHGDPERGIEPCAACHGTGGEGAGRGNPPLAGQPAPYLAAQLRAWRSGERYGDPLGAMTHVSRLLAEPEVDRLAGYSSALPGASANPALPATCLRERRSGPRSGA